jgi:predicted CoA-binding protein
VRDNGEHHINENAMPHTNPSVDELRAILGRTRVIAMVGASSDPSRPSYSVMKILLDAGFDVIPVNPRETEVHGRAAVRSLADITVPIDIVDVFRPAETTPAIADEAVAAGAAVLWLQLGITNDDAAARATAGGLIVVMDECLGAFVKRHAITTSA